MAILPEDAPFSLSPSDRFEPTKVCTGCKRLLPWSCYTIQNNTQKPVSKCKPCNAAMAATKRALIRAEIPPKEIPDPNAPKACTKCGDIKPIEDFYVKIKETGRRFSWCKTCHAAINRENDAKHPGRKARYRREWIAKNPDKERESQIRFRKKNRHKLAERMRVRRKTSKWYAVWRKHYDSTVDQRKAYYRSYKSKNSNLIKSKNSTYRDLNRDLVRKRHRRWIKDHPQAWSVICARAKHRRRDRESKVECTLTSVEWKEILRLQDNRCARCRKRFGPDRKPHKDHVIPLSKGGGLTFKNVSGLCGPCNNKKYTKDTDYRGLLPFFLD